MSDEEKTFQKMGLTVDHKPAEVGQTYPLYGMITKFLCEDLGSIVVEINYNIHAKLHINEKEKLAILKERAFEPGIFISTVEELGDVIKVDCQTVVFGRKQSTQMQ